MTRFLTVATVTLATLAAGCGGSEPETVQVKGRLVTTGGAAFRVPRTGDRPLPPGDPGIRAKFVRVGEPPPGTDAAYYATVNAEAATFEVPGKANRGIPPGTYHVVVAVGADGAPSGGRGTVKGPPGARAPNADSVEVARKEITIPAEGLTDLTIEIETKK